MNGIIKKCVEELAKESPRLDYIRGMLDTLLEMNPEPVLAANISTTPKPTPSQIEGDEAGILDARARAAIKTVQEMGQLE